VAGNLSAPCHPAEPAGERVFFAERQDVEALMFELVPEACFAFRRVIAFDDLTRRRHQPAAKFHSK
jgi:hypothetical protein